MLLEPDDQSIVVDNLDWGFQNITYKKESEFPNFDVLLGKLNAIRQEASKFVWDILNHLSM